MNYRRDTTYGVRRKGRIKTGLSNQGEALYIIKTLVLHIISGKATVSHQADRDMHTYGVMIYAA